MCGEFVDQRLGEYMARHGLRSLTQVVEYLGNDRRRIAEMAEFVYSGQTRFNRSPEHFQFLVDVVQQRQREHAEPEKLVLWCLGCSTGEEAYTMAIYLCERVFPHLQQPPPFHVYAGDCSLRAIAAARRGRYRLSSVRSLEPLAYEKYVEDEDGEYVHIGPVLRELVSFEEFNLVTSTYRAPATVDVVFLRNALDFHSLLSQEIVLRNVRRTLKDDGHLVLGSLCTLAAPRSIDIRGCGYEALGQGCYRTAPPEFAV
jgi:two-component system CheB/CheR fusion protein